MEVNNSLQFDGTGEVNKFITKGELQAALKNHTEEKKAQFIASKLNGVALDIYMRLSTDDKKDPAKIVDGLRNEFSREQRNREEALDLLLKRRRLSGESAETYAYKILELVKLAYSSFSADIQSTIAKDYYVKGLTKEMQVALKTIPDFATKTLNQLATETSRLSIAGIGKDAQMTVNVVHDEMPISTK